MTPDDVETVLARRTAEIMAIAGVVGVGQALCDSTPCIRVYITTDSARTRLPKTLDGVPVDPVVTGPIRPRGLDD